MYRAVTWAVLNAGVDPQDTDAVTKIAAEVDLEIGTDPRAPHFPANGTDVDAAIRGAEVTGAVSAVAAVPAVRRQLVALQRDIIDRAGRIVVEGRDIASVVAPDADLKVYLTASAAARAQRRSAEDATDVAATAADLARRDTLDSSRAVDPLRQADDAIVRGHHRPRHRRRRRTAPRTARQQGEQVTDHLPEAADWTELAEAINLDEFVGGDSATTSRPARCPSSPSSAAPTSASPPWSTGSSAAARRSSRTSPG